MSQFTSVARAVEGLVDQMQPTEGMCTLMSDVTDIIRRIERLLDRQETLQTRREKLLEYEEELAEQHPKPKKKHH